MGIKYTSAQIVAELEKYDERNAARLPADGLYKERLVNYSGTTRDSKEPYSEVVAKWLLEHLDLRGDQFNRIRREASYRRKSHKGYTGDDGAKKEEDRIAKEMFSQRGLPVLGAILDYQTPLKDRQSDGAGKIDLLAYDGSVLRILELKRPKSKETMLRCVLEGYTYFRQVDVGKLLDDFDLPRHTQVRVSPLVFHNGSQHQEMIPERKYLLLLMKKLGISPCYVRVVRKTSCGETRDVFVVTEE